jgi:hypothetical protein
VRWIVRHAQCRNARFEHFEHSEAHSRKSARFEARQRRFHARFEVRSLKLTMVMAEATALGRICFETNVRCHNVSLVAQRSTGRRRNVPLDQILRRPLETHSRPTFAVPVLVARPTQARCSAHSS